MTAARIAYPSSGVELVACARDGGTTERPPGGTYELWAVETFDAGAGTTAAAGSAPLTVAGGP